MAVNRVDNKNLNLNTGKTKGPSGPVRYSSNGLEIAAQTKMGVNSGALSGRATSAVLPDLELDGDIAEDSKSGAKKLELTIGGQEGERGNGKPLDFSIDGLMACAASQSDEAYIEAQGNLGSAGATSDKDFVQRQEEWKLINKHQKRCQDMEAALSDEAKMESQEQAAASIAEQAGKIVGGAKIVGLNFDQDPNDPASNRFALMTAMSYIIGSDKGLSSVNGPELNVSILKMKIENTIGAMSGLSKDMANNAAKSMGGKRAPAGQSAGPIAHE